MENKTEKKIKVLRTDNGGEFCNKEFEEFCKKCGIARQKTTPYTPQQNGVAERINKMLMERARSMLSGAGVRTGILGRGGGYCMLLGQQVTFINVGG